MKNKKIIYGIYLLFPLINLLTGIMTREGYSLTIGMAIKIALLLYMFFYVFFYTKSKYKKISIIYYLILGTFAIFYIITKPNFINIQFLYNEASYLFKFLYYPILLIGMLNFIDEYKYETEIWKKIFFVNLIFYLIFIIAPIFIGKSFFAYGREHEGLIGWFYAANEVGPILIMLFPSLFILLDKHKLLFIILSFLAIFSVVSISTRVSTYGLGIVIILFIILYFIFVRKKCNNKIALLTLLIIYFSLLTPFAQNLYSNLEEYNNNFKDSINENETNKPQLPELIPSKPNENESKEDIMTKLLSNRNKYLEKENTEYKKASFLSKIFGIGFYRNGKINLIEMDFFDIFYHYGILGFIILNFPMFYLLYKEVAMLFKKRIKININFCYSLLILGFLIAIGFLSGHILGAPAVTSILILYNLYFCNNYVVLKE